MTVPAGTDLTVAADLTMPTAVAFTVNGSVTVAGNLTLTDGSIAGTGTCGGCGATSVRLPPLMVGPGFSSSTGPVPQTLTGSSPLPAAGALPNLTSPNRRDHPHPGRDHPHHPQLDFHLAAPSTPPPPPSSSPAPSPSPAATS